MENITKNNKNNENNNLTRNNMEVTLEEAAHKMLINYGIKSMGQSIGVLEVKKLMVNFAKWQQEQDKKMYSEEEMKNAYHCGRLYKGREGDTTFEQFIRTI